MVRGDRKKTFANGIMHTERQSIRYLIKEAPVRVRSRQGGPRPPRSREIAV